MSDPTLMRPDPDGQEQSRMPGGTAGLLPVEPGESAEARRRQILSGLIVVQAALLIFVLAAEGVLVALGHGLPSTRPGTVVFVAVITAFLAGLLLLNRGGHFGVAAFGLFGISTAIALFSLRAPTFETRTLLFVIVIVGASFVLRPAASFPFAALAAAGYTVAWFRHDVHLEYSFILVGTYFVLATVSWVASDRYERALEAAECARRDMEEELHARIAAEGEQRRAAAAVRVSEAFLRGILDNMQDAYVRTDIEGSCIMTSPSAVRMFGFASEDDMIGMPVTSLYADLWDREAIFGELNRLGYVTDYVGWGRRKDGSTFWLSLNAQFYRDEEGNVLGTEGFVRDVSERKQAEDEIRQLNQDLERRVTERTTELEIAVGELESFSYSVSHDLRAPLRALDGFSQILIDDYGTRLDEDALHYLERIRAGAQRMSTLINALLELSRLNRGEIVRRPVDLTALASELIDHLRESDPAREVEAVVADGLTATVDAGLVRALMANLIDNAWKFTAKHTTARIEVGSTVIDSETVFFVRDDGAGFDMGYAGKLFGAFQRMHHPSEFDGAGIGLATVQRIVRRHGGRVWVEAEIEKGATFFFTLPERSRAAEQTT